MLNNVPDAINRMARNVVINHPNTYNCQVVRKTVNRVSGETVGGLPTLGGMGVMSSDDEENISWSFLGNGYALRAEMFAPSVVMDMRDANNDFAEELRYLVEPETAGAFLPKKNDVFYLALGDAIRLAFEIVGVETTSNIPPYTQRYVCNRRPDLFITLP